MLLNGDNMLIKNIFDTNTKTVRLPQRTLRAMGVKAVAASPKKVPFL